PLLRCELAPSDELDHGQCDHSEQHRADHEAADERTAPGSGPRSVVQHGTHRAIATFRSSTPRSSPPGMVMTRYPMTTPTSTGRIGSPAELRSACTSKRSPPTPNAPAIAEFLIIAIMTLPSGGMTVRQACGRITVASVWPKVSPRARAASACPVGTALIPLRTASQTNAAV